MDAPEDDQDVKLQRASQELLADLHRSLEPFLWKQTASGKRKIRRRIRVRETDRLVALLEPFQENPQLLDPSLQDLIPPLADAFLACLQSKLSSFQQPHSQLLMTTSRAICKLLYTFCKVRGEKVIVRFLSTEAKYLEVLLSAIETHRQDEEDGDQEAEAMELWEWEERYVALLWLSQLLFAPFDLASISSQAAAADSSRGISKPTQYNVPGLTWPSDVPSIALRTIPLAIHYLSSSGKERDAAKVLLVRVVMRKDMQELGVLNAIVKWAISCLQPSPDVENSTYYYIGTLSFIAGVLKSSMGTADMKDYLPVIFNIIQGICSSEDTFFRTINASPVIRQTSINILRNISVLLLRNSGIRGSTEMVEWTIGYLLDALGDPATPVRIATSKALSVITLKLAPDMAEQVVEEILNALRKDIMRGIRGSLRDLQVSDLSTVNPLEWHGLILTLSQLLYRRAPPPTQLAQIITALIDGVNFEQRSTSGSSVGTNVRDAANLGIWAVARRYTTHELEAIRTTSSSSSPTSVHISILQKLAGVLVVSASLDPAGNIRRGSSAALQELIGRHPDTITKGIQLVQIVEYSSVALRSKAMKEVAVQTASLDTSYALSLLAGLESWRGVGDPEASARRAAATTYGNVVCNLMLRHWMTVGDESYWSYYRDKLISIENRLKGLQHRQVDERHGLILCLAYTISCVDVMFRQDRGAEKLGFCTTFPMDTLADLRRLVLSMLEDATKSAYRRPELLAEAVSRLLFAFYPLTDLGNLDVHDRGSDIRNQSLEGGQVLDLAGELLGKWLHRTETEVIDAASEAASGLFSLLSNPQQEALVSNWINIILEDQGSRTGQGIGVLSALFQVFPACERSLQDHISRAVHTRWKSGHDIESRVAILQYLGKSGAFGSHTAELADLVSEGLDDYTTDARGDIGSLVRTEALRAATCVWKYVFESMNNDGVDIFETLFPKVLRLAAEKLDKVRSEAQHTVANAFLSRDQNTLFEGYSPSSKEYFRFLLDMPTNGPLIAGAGYRIQWHEDLLEGIVSSADTGSEDLVRASRAALAEFCESDSGNLSTVCGALFIMMKKNLKNDRVLVPTMEVMGFLFDYQIMQRSATNWRALYALVQNSHYQSGNIRKLEAAVKLYGGLLDVYPDASHKLTSMLLHKYPKVRNEAADMLFVKKGVGKGFSWVKARPADLEKLRRSLLAAQTPT